MAFLPCDICGGSTNSRGSWDTPLKIICTTCNDKRKSTNNKNELKSFTDQGYRDVDESYTENKMTNPHHFHHYDSGRVTYKKEFIHLYKN